MTAICSRTAFSWKEVTNAYVLIARLLKFMCLCPHLVPLCQKSHPPRPKPAYAPEKSSDYSDHVHAFNLKFRNKTQDLETFTTYAWVFWVGVCHPGLIYQSQLPERSLFVKPSSTLRQRKKKTCCSPLAVQLGCHCSLLLLGAWRSAFPRGLGWTSRSTGSQHWATEGAV